MNPKNLPKQIRKDLDTVRDLLTSDRPCNRLWLEAAASLLEDVAAQVRAACAAQASPSDAAQRWAAIGF
jgi:hypothetical protein